MGDGKPSPSCQYSALPAVKKLATACGVLCLLAPAPAGATALSAAETSILSEVNRTRAAHGLPALRVDTRLQRAARAHSVDMLRRNYFSHGAFARRLQRFGVRGARLGENLAWGYGPRAHPGAIVGSWLRSPPHRANLLRPGFRRIGLAAPRGRFAGLDGALVVTADFAGR
jgi:uncharacterized protein YkwD